MAPASPKVFLYGYYGFGNVGDNLLLLSVISTLSRFAPTAGFVVRSLNPVASVSNERIQYVALEHIMVRLAWPRWFRLVCYLWEAWRSLHGCSHLVFGGGTLFHARGGSSVNLALIAMLVVMARLRGAQVFALGVGVATLPKGLPRYLMGLILYLTRDFAVRDESSLANCQDLSKASCIRLTGDLVFSLPLVKLPRVSDFRPVLGFTLAVSDIGHDALGNEAFLANLATALQLLMDLGWEIRFLSFQEIDCDGVKLSDTTLFATLHRYGLGQGVDTIRVSSLPEEISHQFADISVVAGMRFHGLVLAALMDIPFVGLGRDSKLADLCFYFSMPFIEFKDLQANRLVAAVEQARRQVLNQQKTIKLSHAAAENFNVVGASFS